MRTFCCFFVDFFLNTPCQWSYFTATVKSAYLFLYTNVCMPVCAYAIDNSIWQYFLFSFFACVCVFFYSCCYISKRIQMSNCLLFFDKMSKWINVCVCKCMSFRLFYESLKQDLKVFLTIYRYSHHHHHQQPLTLSPLFP